MSGSPPRTLADQLRAWSDDELAALLVARPDLATPAPQDTAQLASRASSRASVLRVADSLTMLELAVLDAVVVAGGQTSVEDLGRLVHAEATLVRAAVDRLCGRALLWGPPDGLRVLSAVADALGTTVSGLGPPWAELAASYGPARIAEIAGTLGLPSSGDKASDLAAVGSVLSDPGRVKGLVADLPAAARSVLDHLERLNLEGDLGGAEHRVRPLLDRGLLVQRDRGRVAVPREVAVALRGGRTTREPVDRPPELAVVIRSVDLVDRAAAGAAFEAVRHVELLLEHWGVRPPAVLRAGGLAVRDLRAAARLMHLDESVAALLVETATAAGLVATGPTEEWDSAWLPTEAFDHWMAAAPADRWVRLAHAWLESPRLAGAVGGREGGKVVNALSAELDRSWLVATRREALLELATLDPGTTLAPGAGVHSLMERLRWLRPRRPAARAEAVGWVVDEARVLGVLGLDGLSSPGRALVTADDPVHEAARVLQPLLPDPVEHVVVQADLTAVAPGPLEQQLAHDLALMADVESRGGATVYRFTEQSVRRAFDSGWSVAEVHAFLDSASATEVPQPLRYLVDDVSRKFGVVRVGAAASFLRSDDETALTGLVHHPKAASLRLRRVAPTVVVSDVPVDVLLARLRELGLAPVVEAADGTVRVARKDAYRARVVAPRSRYAAPARSVAHAAAVVTAIRAGDRAAESRPPGTAALTLRRSAPVSTLAQLREAVERGGTVWIGYVDNDGSMLDRVVDPLRVEGGWLTAHDHRTDAQRSFALHRITGVKPADQD